MNDYTNAILIEPPTSAMGLQTFKIGTANTIMPGWAVTNVGEAEGWCTNPNAGDNSVIGIVLDSDLAPLDERIPGGVLVTVAMKGSNAVVYVYCANTDAQNPGVPYRAMDNDTGCVGASAGHLLAIGVNTEYTAGHASYNPIKIRLCQ